MCGIVGAVSNRPVDSGLLAAMRDDLAHRGPDHAGVWGAADARTCLGHRRLAIIDLQAEANQPFVSSDGRYVITFNGEIYNYRALRTELEGRGSRFRTRSDTEVLVEAYRAWGKACLDRLSGMFAFAIWDTHRERLFCARDRAGEKPFYYALSNGAFVFASEVKSLLRWPGLARRLDHTALVDYLTFGFVPDPKCIWEDCAKLPPGHWLEVRRGADGPVLHGPIAWWDLEFTPDEARRDWASTFRDTLASAAAEMTAADVPVGTFLSGGVDSSSVTAALSMAGITPHTFTIGFDEAGLDEREWARQVAERYHTRHTERVVRQDDVASVLDTLLWHYDEPFNDYSYLPTYYLCREARRTITVALSGDGADEAFAGYRKYQRLGLRRAVNRWVPAPVARAIAGVAMAGLPQAAPLRRTVLQYGTTPAAALGDMLVLGFNRPALQRAARGRLAAVLADYDPLDTVTSLLRKAPPREVGLVNAMRYLDMKLTLAGDMLVKVDRASMAVALEVRPVYLHRDMLALAARIPSRLLASRAQAKRVVKDALRPWLPAALLYRRKMGFALPLGRWIGGDGESPFAATGRTDGLAELLDPRLLPQLAQAHVSGTADHTPRIHSLQLLERWLARWQPDGPALP